MTERFEENLMQKDIADSEKKDGESGFELERGDELNTVVDLAHNLYKKIERDQHVTGDDFLDLDEVLGRVKVNVRGDRMTVEEMKEIPDFKKNAKIWKQILDFDQHAMTWSYRELTYIPAEICEIFVDWPQDMHLDKVVSLSDESAHYLSQVKGILFLDRIRSLSDQASEYLGQHKGAPEQDSDSLHLDSLETISDQGLRNLAKHPGWVLLPQGELQEKFSAYREELKKGKEKIE